MIKPILKVQIKKITHDTNNGWGFGGSICKVTFHKGNTIEIKSEYCYRHLPSDRGASVYKIHSDKLFNILLSSNQTAQELRSRLGKYNKINHRVECIYIRGAQPIW